MDRNKKKKLKIKLLCKCIMANTIAILQQVAHVTYQLPSLSCSTRAIHLLSCCFLSDTNMSLTANIEDRHAFRF